ncbi:hypothetical protein WJX75_001727 [Coccomyxa subellipsoidea]|uniref:Amino acid transporter transmembrane domain-containing protein n=1 Tax=Coccomyxa subellipsoidea TaxID=248742 RepID=A0ABR2YRL8_9CHLO
MADAMRNQGAVQWAYFFGWLWTLTLILPHSIAANLAWPDQVYAQDNIYSVLPHSIWKIISVWLMNIHQLVAFSLYVVPLLFMWEKLIRVHSKPWYIRLPLRLPVSLALYLIGVAFPFYGTINSLYKALAEPLTAFVFPAAVYTWVYRSQSARSGAVLKPWKFLRKANWLLIWILNISIIIVWLFGQFGFGVYFSSQKLHNNIRSFGVFAQCYQCKSSAPKLHAPALAPHAARNFTAGAYLAPAHAPYSVEASTFSSPFG